MLNLSAAGAEKIEKKMLRPIFFPAPGNWGVFFPVSFEPVGAAAQSPWPAAVCGCRLRAGGSRDRGLVARLHHTRERAPHHITAGRAFIIG